ncbi:MAG: hypothetical protein J6C37_02765, partial [Roseburia sp.]|nr:hypothetical protein [Roseburia sp.]
MITRKIARNGMRGRKKVSVLLILVLTFTFIFITTAVLLETSMTQTRIRQREKLYGTWQAAYLRVDESEKEAFLSEPDVTEAVVSCLVGKDSEHGTVSVISREMVDMGNITLTQGRLPEHPQEIVLEESVANELGITTLSGDKVTLNLERTLVSEDKQSYLYNTASELIQLGSEGDYTQISTYRRQYTQTQRISDNLMLSVNSEYSFLTDAESSTMPEDIEENGLLYGQKLNLNREYEVTGIVQSFSDFWDTGSFPVGEMFVCQEEADILLEAIRQNSIKDLSDYSYEYNIYARSDTLGENLFDELQEKYVTPEEKETGNSRAVAFRRNTYAYPNSGGEVEETLTFLVIMVIFVITFCAILQIFLTQMKQRARKIALLKSIGTTNRQVC